MAYFEFRKKSRSFYKGTRKASKERSGLGAAEVKASQYFQKLKISLEFFRSFLINAKKNNEKINES